MVYTIAAPASAPQISCETLEAAVEVAMSFARQSGARVWFTTDQAHYKPVLED